MSLFCFVIETGTIRDSGIIGISKFLIERTVMNVSFKRAKKRVAWLMLAPLLLGLGTTAVTSTTELAMDMPLATVAYADHSKKKGNNKPSNKNDGKKDDKKSSGGKSSGGNKSKNSTKSTPAAKSDNEWNQALDTLAKNANDDLYSDSKHEAKDRKGNGTDAIDFAQVVGSGHVGSSIPVGRVWGFISSTNETITNANSKAGATVDYNGLIQMSNQNDRSKGGSITFGQAGDAYKQSARLAYVLQASGLDRATNNGLGGHSNLQSALGFIMSLGYFFGRATHQVFKWILHIMQMIDPIYWAEHGVANNAQYFGGLADLVHRVYEGATGVGIALFGLTILATILFGMLGFRLGTNGQMGRGSALISGFMSLISRALLFVAVPIMCLSLYSATLNKLGTAFNEDRYNPSAYAIMGSFFNTQNAVTNSRFAIPDDVGSSMNASFSNSSLPVFSHDQILKLNQESAGASGASDIVSKTTFNKASGDSGWTNLDSGDPDGVTNAAQRMLSKWRNQTNFDASTYASGVTPYLNQILNGEGATKDSKGDASNIADLLKQERFNTNGNLMASGNSSDDTFSGGTSVNGNNQQGLNPSFSGGFSTLGMYAYLLSTASDTQLQLTDTSNLNNMVTAPQHAAVTLVGANGVQSFGNLMWSFGLTVGISILGIGFAIAIMKALVVSVPNILVGMTLTGFQSFRGYAKLAGAVIAMFLGTLGSAMLYQIFCQFFIGIAQAGDDLINQQLPNQAITNFFYGHGSAQIGQLASVPALGYGAWNILYGAMLIWMAILLLKYRHQVLALVSSYIEGAIDSILNTLSNASMHGSVSSSINAMNQSTGISNAVNRLGGGMLGASGRALGGLGGVAGAGMMGAALAGGNKMGAGTHASDKATNGFASSHSGKDSASQQASKSSAEKQGNASREIRDAAGNRQGDAARQMANSAPTDIANGQGQSSAMGNQALAAQANQMAAGQGRGQGVRALGNAPAGAQAGAHSPMTAAQYASMQAGQGMSRSTAGQGIQSQSMGQGLQSQSMGRGSIGAGSPNAQGNAVGLANDQQALGNAADQLAQDRAKGASPEQIGADEQQLQGAANQLAQDQPGALGQNQKSANQIGSPSTQGTPEAGLAGESIPGQNGMSAGEQGLGANEVPVSDVTGDQVEGQMPNVRAANQEAEQASALAQANPGNATLAAQANDATQAANDAQMGALQDYNSQPAQGAVPEGLLSPDASSDLSVGTVANNVDAIQSANQGVQDAVERYGADSPQAIQASQDLVSAQNSAVHAGLSEDVVHDMGKIDQAQEALSGAQMQIKDGSWTMGNQSSVANIDLGVQHDTIGL